MKKPRLNILYFLCMILLLIVCTVKLFSLLLSPLIEETILLRGVWAFLALASFIGALFSFRKKQEEHIKRNFGQVFALKSDSYHVSRQRKKKPVINIYWRELSKRKKKIILSLFICLSWFTATVFISAIWSVLSLPKPLPLYSEAELIYLLVGILLTVIMGFGLILDKVWAGPVGYIFGFIQMLWFPVGLFTGLLLMILLNKIARKPLRLKLKRNDYWTQMRKKKQEFASQQQVNESLSFGLDNEDINS